MDLCATDYTYFLSLQIVPEAKKFFEAKGAEVRKAGLASSLALRDFQFEIIIDQYLRETNIADHDEDEEKSITCDVEFNNRHDEIVPQSMDGIAEKIRNLKCVSHDIKLTLIGSQKTVSVIDGDTIDFPILRCDKCGRLYTYVPGIRENQSIKIKKKRYFNLCDSREIREEKNHIKTNEGTAGIWWENKKRYKGFVYNGNRKAPKTCEVCKSSIYKEAITIKNQNGTVNTYSIKKCKKCGIVYLDFRIYEKVQSDVNCLNPRVLEDLKQMDRRNKQVKRQISSNPKQIYKPSKKERQQRAVQQYEMEVEKLKQRANWKSTGNKKVQIETSRPKKGDITIISLEDCLIRKDVFHCEQNDHKIDVILARVSVLNQQGEIEEEQISVGYCSLCNLYYISEHDLRKAQKKGVLLCRLVDEREKNETHNNSPMNLSQASILMEYGYNVNAAKGLSKFARRAILIRLIENNIISSSRVIQYLDFFIRQRKSNDLMKDAISKWESDRDFIKEYAMGKARNRQ